MAASEDKKELSGLARSIGARSIELHAPWFFGMSAAGLAAVRAQIEEAHAESVRRALEYLETEAGYTRRGKGAKDRVTMLPAALPLPGPTRTPMSRAALMKS